MLLSWFKNNRTNVFLFAFLFEDAPRGGQKNFIRSIFPINNHHDWCLRYASRKCILGSTCPRQTFDKSWGRKPSFSWWNCGANRFLCYSELVHIRTQCKSANFKYDIGKLSTLPRNRNIYRVQVLYLKLRATENQGGRTWQAFGGGKHGHETFRQAHNYNFRDKCVVFARNLKFSNLTQ